MYIRDIEEENEKDEENPMKKIKLDDSEDILDSEEIEQDLTTNEQPSKKNKKSNKKGSKSKFLYIPDIMLIKTDRDQYLNVERRFKYYLDATSLTQHSTDQRIVARCYVLDNNICVLVSPKPLKAKAITWQDSVVNTGHLSGKFKKGAKHIDSFDKIADVILEDNQEVSLISPIAGRVLEVNEKLSEQLQFLYEQPFNAGFLAVISSEAPTIIDRKYNLEAFKENSLQLVTDFPEGDIRISACFAYLKGYCARGNQCKFTHSEVPPTIDV